MFNLVKLFPKSIWSLFILLSTSCYAIDYTYDELHRLVKVEYESGQTIHYQYDAGGNLLSQVGWATSFCCPPFNCLNQN